MLQSLRLCFELLQGPAYRFIFCCAQSCLTLCDPKDCSHQAPLSMGFSRQECWSGLPFPTPGDLPNPGITPASVASPALASRFFVAGPGFFFCNLLCILGGWPMWIMSVGSLASCLLAGFIPPWDGEGAGGDCSIYSPSFLPARSSL